jgi:hypothetical protein
MKNSNNPTIVTVKAMSKRGIFGAFNDACEYKLSVKKNLQPSFNHILPDIRAT